MDNFVNWYNFCINNSTDLRLLTPHYAELYPQNGDRIVTIDSVTSLHPMYSVQTNFSCNKWRSIYCTVTMPVQLSSDEGFLVDLFWPAINVRVTSCLDNLLAKLTLLSQNWEKCRDWWKVLAEFCRGNGFLLTWSSVAVSVFGRLLRALHRPVVKDFFCLFFIVSIFELKFPAFL